MARAVCGPATTAFVRAFAAVGDGFGSALTAGSRAASPKLDPSRGHSLSGGQVATPPVLPRFRLRRLLPPLTPSSLPLRGHASAAGGRPPDFSNCSDLFHLRGKVFPLVRVYVSPSPFQRGHPATPRMPASRPEIFQRSLALDSATGAITAFRSHGSSLRSETASAPRSRLPLAMRRPGATLREVAPSRHRPPCRARAFADSSLCSHPLLNSTSRLRLGSGRNRPPER